LLSNKNKALYSRIRALNGRFEDSLTRARETRSSADELDWKTQQLEVCDLTKLIATIFCSKKRKVSYKLLG